MEPHHITYHITSHAVPICVGQALRRLGGGSVRLPHVCAAQNDAARVHRNVALDRCAARPQILLQSGQTHHSGSLLLRHSLHSLPRFGGAHLRLRLHHTTQTYLRLYDAATAAASAAASAKSAAAEDVEDEKNMTAAEKKAAKLKKALAASKQKKKDDEEARAKSAEEEAKKKAEANKPKAKLPEGKEV
jgi:hypothetical protein